MSTRLRSFWSAIEPVALMVALFWFAIDEQLTWVIVAGLLLLWEAVDTVADRIVAELHNQNKLKHRNGAIR